MAYDPRTEGEAAAFCRELIARTATARGWSAGWAAVGEACVAMAERRTEDTAVAFWDELVYRWFMVDSTTAPAGWTNLYNAWIAAYDEDFSRTYGYSRDSSTVYQVASAVDETVNDVTDVAKAAGTAVNAAVDAAKSPWTWFAGLALILAAALAKR